MSFPYFRHRCRALFACSIPSSGDLHSLEQARARRPIGGSCSVVIFDDRDQRAGGRGEELAVFPCGPENDSVGPALRNAVMTS